MRPATLFLASSLVVNAAGFLGLSETGTRLSAGPYYATRDVFDDDRRFGAQVTLEQPVPPVPGLTLAGDWFSGDGAGGAGTLGCAGAGFTGALLVGVQRGRGKRRPIHGVSMVTLPGVTRMPA